MLNICTRAMKAWLGWPCVCVTTFTKSWISAPQHGCRYSKNRFMRPLILTAESLGSLRLQYTFGSVIFFKFGFLGQNSGRRIISNFWKKFLKKAKYWRRNGGFKFSSEVKVYLLIDSPMARMQSTETIFAGIYLYRCHELTTQLISIVVLNTQHFLILGVSLSSYK